MSCATPSDEGPSAIREDAVLPVALFSGCLYALIFLNLVQLAAGLAGMEPGPPANVLPMIAGTTAIGLVAVPLIPSWPRLGLAIGSIFCLVSMIGMGPHKLFFKDGLVIAPVAIIGFLAEITFLWFALRHLTTRDRS
jgi:hypothetical protein